MKIKKELQLSCADCKSHSSSLFGALCSQELTDISEVKSCIIYKKGQILFHEGTRPLGVFCINEGKVKVYQLGSDGKEQIMKIAKAGDILGYKAMISEEHYPVTAETLDDCTICFVPKNDFLTLLSANQAFNSKLLKAVCHELGVMSEKLTNLAQKSVRERLAIALLMLKDTYGVEGDLGTPVEINLSREDLANIVGTATETLIRLLHDFKEDSYISIQGRKIKVEDEKGLAKVAKIL